MSLPCERSDHTLPRSPSPHVTLVCGLSLGRGCAGWTGGAPPLILSAMVGGVVRGGFPALASAHRWGTATEPSSLVAASPFATPLASHFAASRHSALGTLPMKFSFTTL